jgi:hypothetical protein
VNEEEKEQEEEINKKSQSLGLETSQSVSLVPKSDSMVKALAATSTTTPLTTKTTSKINFSSKRNFESEPTRIHYRKADTEKSSQGEHRAV